MVVSPVVVGPVVAFGSVVVVAVGAVVTESVVVVAPGVVNGFGPSCILVLFSAHKIMSW